MLKQDPYIRKAEHYLQTLCSVQPNRRTGSAGNWEASQFIADTIRPFGYEIDATPFPCLDYVREEVLLAQGDQTYQVLISPYSIGCDVTAELVVVSTMAELEASGCQGKILLMHGAICAEQLMPKNFIFYNPEHHQQIIAFLEAKQPAGIITATQKNPELIGALYPFPIFLDGDFDIPSVYCTDLVGNELSRSEGECFHLRINARRIPSQAANVIARLNPAAGQKIVITAHIDAYEGSPGAVDNASGTAVLLLLAEMLADYHGPYGIEIAAFNGEDHYSVGGQMDYLGRYGAELPATWLAINVDGVGYKEGRAAYSLYGCEPQLEQHALEILDSSDGLVRGERWYNGDHMIFVQIGVSCIALTAELLPEIMRTVVHAEYDTPQIVDCGKIVDVAQALNVLIRSI